MGKKQKKQVRHTVEEKMRILEEFKGKWMAKQTMLDAATNPGQPNA